MDTWSLHRKQIYARGEETPFVLLGASRIQLGFALDELTRRYPEYRPIQLAIDGHYPWAALRDLAQDEDFRGIVLCSIKAEGFSRSHWEDQSPYVTYYQNHSNLNKRINAWISSQLQSRIALMYPTLRLDNVLKSLIETASLPAPPYLVTLPSRERIADYSLTNMDAFRQDRIASVKEHYADLDEFSPAEWLQEAMQIEPYVRAIQKRGGTVVFVRYPSSGEYWEYEERTCPKAQCWDILAEKTEATTIHFRDFPTLARFDCPDTSHLDYRDAIPFTHSLLEILERRGVLREERSISHASHLRGQSESNKLTN